MIVVLLPYKTEGGTKKANVLEGISMPEELHPRIAIVIVLVC